jgi:hypothetical protein
MKSPKSKDLGSIPKPATMPAKRKPGQPRRADPRTRTLPRVSELTHALLSAYADQHDCYLADAIEAAALALETTQRTTVQALVRVALEGKTLARRTKPTGHQPQA